MQSASFIAANATVIGDLTLSQGCSIWYGAILRADVERIYIGQYSNIQDGAILHGDPGEITHIGDYVTVGHRAVIHSAKVENGSLIGIGAIVLNGVTVGSGSIIAAGSVVTKDIPESSLAMGIPAKVVRQLSAQERAELIVHAEKYHQLALVHAGLDLAKGS
jgi:carbonic anhydrase/acetyltransferase-like protein (isoleucine patch superfamily)